MNKFLVTFTDGSHALCYCNKDQWVTNHGLARSAIIDGLPPLLLGEASTERGIWHMGFSSASRTLTEEEAVDFIAQPRCYLNTQQGREKLQRLCLLANAAKTLQGRIA
jgi:hypothetical protein